MHRRGVVLGPTRAVVFLLPIAIILLVPLMRIGVHAMANVGGRYVSLDMLYAEPEGRTRQGRDTQRRRRRAEGR